MSLLTLRFEFRNCHRSVLRQAYPLGIVLAFVALSHASPAMAQSLPMNLVSQGVNGETANGESRLGAVGGAGFIVAFTSTATNLIVDEAVDPAFSRVYLHSETSLLRLRQISRGLGATANGSSRSPAVSTSGQHVVFASDASNLIATDNNPFADIFAVYADSLAMDPPDPALTVRLSTNELDDAPNGSSRNPVISGDGRHVLFESRADNLDPGSGISRNFFDLFVVDRDADRDGVLDEAGTLRPVRVVQFDNGMASLGAFRGYDISRDGRFVVFSTAFLGVTTDPVTATYNLYFHDRDTDVDGNYDEMGAVATTLLGRGVANGAALSMDADYPEIDADSLRVIYHSRAPEIQTVCASGSDCSIFIVDIPANGPDIRLPESATLLRGLAGRAGRNARLNTNGSLLTYTSASQPRELRLHNIQAATDTSLCLSQTQRRANRGCGFALAGTSAQFVAVDSMSSNLVPLDVNAQSDVFIRNTIATPPSRPASTACDDQIDNDGNNLIDLEDPGCFAPEDDNEAPGEVVKLIPVTSAASRIGAFTVIDQQGRPGEDPDFALAANGLGHAAYSAGAFRFNSVGGASPIDELRTAVFEPLAGGTTLRGEGTRPKVATGSQNQLHVSYQLQGGPNALAYTVGDLTPPQLLSFAGSCDFGNRYNHALVLDSSDAPRIPNWDSCSNEFKIWRPGISVTVIATSQLDGIEPIDAAISTNNELVLAYVDNAGNGTVPDELELVRLDNSDVVLARQRELVPQNPVSLDVRTDAVGTGHVAYTGDISFERFTGALLDPALIYFHEQGGIWVRQELYLPERISGYSVQIRFAADGVTPAFVLTPVIGPGSDESLVRQFVFANGEFSELQSLAVLGAIEQFALDQSADGNIEFVYQDHVSGNVVHADPDASAWIPSTVHSAPFTDLRDLSLLDQPRRFTSLPAVLTFNAASPFAAGEVVLYERDRDNVQWVSQVIGAAFPQDALDLSENAQMLVQFLNSDQSLRYFEQIQPGVWSQSMVANLPGFNSMDNLHVAGNPDNRVEIFGIQRAGDGKTGGALVAYTRSGRNDPWQQHLFDSNPITVITEGQAGRSFFAYVDGMDNDLHLARFDRTTGQWSSELVDVDVAPISIGKTVSLQVVPERFGPTGLSGPGVPTIAYRTASRDRIRYAMKANAWRIWEYEETLPAGLTIDGINHQLINGSRLRPLIAARLSDDSVVSYRRAGGAAADDADAVLIERELVATDGRRGNGLGLVHVALTATTNVAYSNAGAATLLTVGNQAMGLPMANPAYASERRRDARSKVLSDLAPFLCGCFIAEVFASPSGACEVDGVKSGDKSKGGPNEPIPDEQALGQWGILFNRTVAGSRYIDFYARDYPKIARLVAQDPGLMIDGVDALQNFMPGIRAMVDGYGDQVFLTQDMINDGLDIWQRLSDRDDGTLTSFIEAELLMWNDMQDFVGLSFDQWGTLIGLEVGAVGADLLFADSFED